METIAVGDCMPKHSTCLISRQLAGLVCVCGGVCASECDSVCVNKQTVDKGAAPIRARVGVAIN